MTDRLLVAATPILHGTREVMNLFKFANSNVPIPTVDMMLDITIQPRLEF